MDLLYSARWLLTVDPFYIPPESGLYIKFHRKGSETLDDLPRCHQLVGSTGRIKPEPV